MTGGQIAGPPRPSTLRPCPGRRREPEPSLSELIDNVVDFEQVDRADDFHRDLYERVTDVTLGFAGLHEAVRVTRGDTLRDIPDEIDRTGRALRGGRRRAGHRPWVVHGRRPASPRRNRIARRAQPARGLAHPARAVTNEEAI